MGEPVSGLEPSADQWQPNQCRRIRMTEQHALETAVLGGGCFWCLEAVFQEVQGVQSVVSGYAGGHVDRPSYRA
ncbi:peptide-methionine (S)-S-oxide reductase, partial [Mycobacterium tuberculosis]|nr:peptide-methionine (S)-S-oxide reductase [Mycobacterium tuberculosis]